MNNLLVITILLGVFCLMNCRVELSLNSEKRYLESLYPVKWTAFISSSLIFENERIAREHLNTRYSSLLTSLDNNQSLVSQIVLVTMDNGKIISINNYIGGISL